MGRWTKASRSHEMYLLILFFYLFLIYLGCWGVWACVWIYSHFVNKGRAPWLKGTLVTTGIIGLCPLLICITLYTISYVTSHPSVSRVSGSYYGSFDGEKDTLMLRPNGSFSQRFVTGAGKEYTMEGKWHLNRSDGEFDTLSFDHVIVGIGSGGRRLSTPSEPSVINGSVCFWKKDQGSNDDEPENCFTR